MPKVTTAPKPQTYEPAKGLAIEIDGVPMMIESKKAPETKPTQTPPNAETAGEKWNAFAGAQPKVDWSQLAEITKKYEPQAKATIAKIAAGE